MNNLKLPLACVLIILFQCRVVKCQSSQNDLLITFDKFCKIFDQNYASFEEKQIDWDKMCEESRIKISSSMSDEDFFDLLSDMLRPLNDGHVTLRAKDLDKGFSANRPSRIIKELESIPGKERRPKFKKMTWETLKSYGFKEIKEIGPVFRGEKLFHFSDNGKIGYLRMLRSFSKRGKMVGVKLQSQLDQIFNSFQGLEGIVIDVRFNMGGEDKFSQNIVGRIIDDEIIGLYKQTHANGEFGPLKKRMVKPKGKKTFRNKVVLITNDRTVSAADVLALMMSQLPNVTIIGEPSNGSYSDLYDLALPNGWKLTLSNQRYFSVDMKNYEGLGTPVDIECLNTLEDVISLNDSVLKVGLDLLNE